MRTYRVAPSAGPRSTRAVAGAVAGLAAALTVALAPPAQAHTGPTAHTGPVPAAVLPAAPPEPAPVLGVIAPCAATTAACVQLSTQHAWLIHGGRVVDDGFIDSGADGMATPTGIFHVQWKDRTHYSSEYDTPMPYAVFFDNHGDALHEGSLARQSAGCVHLDHDTTVAFFDALQPGDEEQILP